ncbi:hypothetical protein QMZ92_31095 [Streptomyces sp. HNM0645]|uniref:hypothetical protein n=1 Tax=Streptomyces sp. HNM0645 TaxID=2782343 RepID=UPI0024B7B6C5|nr:hypothetical protein [Streptomyces sp. HNM0645]MDI9888684.1 hypothetical protein [Streptomyces sp. HNM0645]
MSTPGTTTAHRSPTRTGRRLRRAAVALLLCCALLGGTTACGGDDEAGAAATPTDAVEAQKFAKTRFVANAGLAAGAVYQWIVKPYRAGKFQKGAEGQKTALVKAGLAGAFAYNRLKAAATNAKGDPLLAKAIAPVSAGIESLKGLGSKIRKGQVGDADIGALEDVVNQVKDAGRSAGAVVKEKVPSATQLSGG